MPRFGGRAWTAVSAALLVVPSLLLALLVPSLPRPGPAFRAAGVATLVDFESYTTLVGLPAHEEQQRRYA